LTSPAFGIDLGTSNIKIYSRHSDSILLEKNMIAYEGRSTLLAYGDTAFEMYEKSPDNITISFPLTNGVIADINSMQRVLKGFLRDCQGGTLKPADYYIAVLTDITEVEKRAFYDLVREAGVKPRRVMMVEKAIADGLGVGVDVKTAHGVFMVDVGYDSTEISVLSLGGIVVSKLLKTGGSKFDASIQRMIRDKFGLVIGQKTAESVKMELEGLKQRSENAVICGRDVVLGLPVEREIPTEAVDECLMDLFIQIVSNVKLILERTPPELSADIYRQGIFLTGGGCLISGFAEILSEGTKLKVNVPENPLTCIANGLSLVIKDANYHTLAYEMEAMSIKL